MEIMSRRLDLKSVLTSILMVMGSLQTQSSRADNLTQFRVVDAAGGSQVTFGQCPCYRWTVEIKGVGVSVETREILVSIDSLVYFRQTNPLAFDAASTRFFGMGSAEFLSKATRLGIGFDGLTLGRDDDRQLKNILQTGFYAMVSILAGDSEESKGKPRLDLRAGYKHYKYKNSAGVARSRDFLAVGPAFAWNSGPWSAKATAYVGFDAEDLGNSDRMIVGGSGEFGGRVYTVGDLVDLGFRAEGRVEYDPGLEKFFNLNPVHGVVSVFMQLSIADYNITNGD